MEQGDQSQNEAATEAVGGAEPVPAQAPGRSSSRRRNGRRKRIRRKPKVTTYDSNSIGYDWLPPGWLAEVYSTGWGRTYKRYFDTWGRPYHTRYEVMEYLKWLLKMSDSEDEDDNPESDEEGAG